MHKRRSTMLFSGGKMLGQPALPSRLRKKSSAGRQPLRFIIEASMEQTFILKKKACHLNAADKLLLLVCIFLLATVTTALAQAQASSAIRAVIDAQAAAWNRGDIDGFM